MRLEGPRADVAGPCERVLRTLPRWFGIESALLEYVRDTARYPTFVAIDDDAVIGFITVREHFPEAWEVHCIAVEHDRRGGGAGRALHAQAERWVSARGVRLLQVKTLAASHPSPEYAQTRRFYEAMGYVAVEVFPTLWGPSLPVLQMVKALAPPA